MQPPPALSVVIPTRERPELLARAIRSVVEQEHPGEIECIVVVDQAELVEPAVEMPPRRSIRVVPNTRTPGLAGARNTGYLLATGDLVAACDDDDEWLPGKVAAQVALLAAHPGAALAATGIVIHYDGRDIPRDTPPAELAFVDFLRDRRMEVHPSTFMARRADVVDGFGLVDEAIPGGYAEDYAWLLRATRRGPVVSVPERLVRVHWHAASFFVNRWKTIDEALGWLLAEVPEFASEPRGLGRIEGQIAFANAAMGRRRRAFGYVRKALRHHPRSRQAWAALPVLLGVVSANQVVSLGRRFGRGV